MIFWRKFTETCHPKLNGWYLVTVDKNNIRHVTTLYWNGRNKTWRDNRKQHIFDLYRVYDYKNDRVYTSSLCDKTNIVVAWSKLPKAYHMSFHNKNKGERYEKESNN